MTEFNAQKKKRKHDKGLEKNPQVLCVNFYGALKCKNEMYFQMASLFKEVTHSDKKQDEHQLKTKWMKQILLSNFSDIHGKSFINSI